MSPHTTLNGDADPDTRSPAYEKQRDAEAGNGHANSDEHKYGPGPNDPYTHHKADGTPIVAEDELRIAGMCFFVVDRPVERGDVRGI
jgi:hypothetical protein